MGSSKIILENMLSSVKKNWFIFFAILVYVFFTFYYMGPSVTSCTTTVYGFGDNTAGPIWSASLPESQGLLGSYTHMTNAPFGDNLYSPIGYSLVLQSVLIKTSEKVAGPVCGYNIINMLGFILSALVMFGFVYAITRNKWIALFSGYAASFTPYYQMKVGGHPSYGYQAIFVGLIWFFYRLLKYRQIRDAILLSVIFAIAIYFDPYFSLLAALTIIPLGLVWLGINKKIFTKDFWQRKEYATGVKRQLKLLLIAAGASVLLAMPLIFIFSTQGKQISSNVAASRGNVLAEAQACSNWPHEYLVPFVLNPIVRSIVGDDRYIGVENFLKDGFSCGIGEDSVGLSLALVSIVSLGMIVIIWERINKKRTNLGRYLHFEPKILVYGLIAIALVALIIGFPPLIFHNIVPTPSYELLKITSTWRTLTRVYMLVNISLVVLSAIFITYFYRHFNLKKHLRLSIILFVSIFMVVFVEYQAFTPFSGNGLSTFNYDKDIPSQYTWLKNQQNIKTIAEYPLERSGGESNAMAYYLTMQVIHKKKLFNSALSYSPQEDMKTGLKNLSDPQTLPVLKGMGVDAVVVHGVDKSEIEKIPNVKILYLAPQASFNILSYTPTVKNDIVAIIGLENMQAQHYAIALGKGFVRNTTIINSAVDWQYEAVQDSVMDIKNLKDTTNTNQLSDVCFDIKMSSLGDSDLLHVNIDGKEGPTLEINDSYKTVEVQANKYLTLHNNIGHNMRVTGIGCK